MAARPELLQAASGVVAWGDGFYGKTSVPPDLTNAVALAATRFGSLALREDGSLSGWGNPVGVPEGLTNVAVVTGGYNHFVAVNRDGTVRHWGTSLFWPDGLSNIVATAAGEDRDIFLRADGTIATAPENSIWPGLSNVWNVTAVSFGQFHPLALRSDGQVVSPVGGFNWGPPPPGLSNAVAIVSGESHNLALRADGIPFAWGTSAFGATNMIGVSNIVAIEAGPYHSLMLSQDGKVIIRGSDFQSNPIVNQLPSSLSNVVTLAAGFTHALAITNQGEAAIARQPTSRRVFRGETTLLSAGVVGVGPLQFQWFHEGAPLTGTTNSGLWLTNVQASAAGAYQLVASNSLGMVTSRLAAVELVDQSPTFYRQPSPIDAAITKTATFAPDVVGSRPMTFQWQFNSVDLPGATNQILVVSNLTLAAAGQYRLVASNHLGVIVSSNALLSVLPVVGWGANSLRQTETHPAATNILMLAAGERVSRALREDGAVVWWGDGQLGDVNLPFGDPRQKVVMIADGGQNQMTLHAGGGAGAANGYSAHASNIVSIGVSPGGMAMALRNDGELVVFTGSGGYLMSRPDAASNVVAFAAGGSHTVGLRQDGTVVAWGFGFNGETNVPPGLANVTAVAAGSGHSLALTRDGGVTAWGANASGQCNVPLEATNIVAIACGPDFSMALRRDGRVISWGSDVYGQTQVPAALSNVVAIAAGSRHALAYAGDPAPVIITPPLTAAQYSGKPVLMRVEVRSREPLSYQWYLNGQPITGETNAFFLRVAGTTNLSGSYTVRVAGTTRVIASPPAQLDVIAQPPVFLAQPTNIMVRLGASHTLTAQATGSLPISYQWEFNGTPIPGALGGSYTITNVASARVGAYRVVATNPTGTSISTNALVSLRQVDVFPWGPNPPYYPNNLTNVVTVTEGAWGEFHALLGNGNVVSWSIGGPLPVAAHVTNVIAIAGSGGMALGLRDDGTVTHLNGSLIAGLSNITAIATGADSFGSFGLALRRDRTIHAWSTPNPQHGQTNVPAAATNVIAIAAGDRHALAVRGDGTVVAWGDNTHGKATVPPGLTGVAAVTAGELHSVALRTNGLVEAWGIAGVFGGPLVPPGLADVVAIAARRGHTLALRTNGTIVAWGQDVSGGPFIYVPLHMTNAVGLGSGYYTDQAILNESSSLQSIPVSRRHFSGETVFINAPASPAGAAFQWRRNGALLAGQTNSFLSLSGSVPAQSGLYSVIARTAWLAITNDAVQLVVTNSPPLFTSTPTNQAKVVLSRLDFTAQAEGSLAMNYQWQRNGTNLPGQTAATLTTPNLQLAASGSYRVRAFNSFGEQFSPSAELVVIPVVGWGWSGNPLLSGPVTATNALRMVTPQLFVRADGRVAVGSAVPPNVASWYAGLSNVVAATRGDYDHFALHADGTLSATGYGWFSTTNIPVEAVNLVDVAAAGSWVMALRADGTVLGWGDTNVGSSKMPPGLTNITAIANQGSYGLALRHDGTVVAWTDNYSAATNIPPGLSGVVALSAGSAALALKSDGSVVAWGGNNYGEASVPLAATNVVAIAAGNDHSLALRSNGEVIAWGASNSGQTTPPASLTNALAIAADLSQSWALVGDGRPQLTRLADQAIASGRTLFLNAAAGGQRPFSFQWSRNNVPLAGATNSHLMLADVTPSQSGDYALTFTNPRGATSVTASVTVTHQAPALLTALADVAVSPATNVTFASNVGGSLPMSIRWQYDGVDIPGATGSTLTLTNVQPAAAGLYRLVLSNAYGLTITEPARLTLLPLVAWGSNYEQQLALPLSLTNVAGFAAGFAGSVALRNDGTLVAWGGDHLGFISGLPANLNQVVQVSATEHVLALRSDGTVAAWGRNNLGQTQVPDSLTNVVAVAAGSYHSLALRADGTVVAWGTGDPPNVQPPPGLSGVKAIAADRHNLALKQDGTVLAWGGLMDGPEQVPAGLGNVTAIAAGDGLSLALLGDGRIVAWGNGYYGNTNVPPELTNVVAIAARFNAAALKSDGTVIAWGREYNSNGQFTGQNSPPANLSNVLAISAGAGHLLALVDGLQAPPPLLHRRLGDAGIGLVVPSFPKANYHLEHNATFDPETWMTIESLSGNGGALWLTEPDASAPWRFYRIRQD